MGVIETSAAECRMEFRNQWPGIAAQLGQEHALQRKSGNGQAEHEEAPGKEIHF
jgi:hypothetical protein